MCEAPAHGACLVAWEPPGRRVQRDAEREFEVILSVEPTVVREALETALEIVVTTAPDVVAQAQDRLAQPPAQRGDDQLRLASAITVRVLQELR